jgi:two-component system nitrate/nitrite response regulator NarL
MDKIKLFILDDHQMLIDGIKALLKNEKQFEVVGESVSAQNALDEMKSKEPHIVLTDINMPEMGGVEFTTRLKKEYPKIKILALSMFGDRQMITDMLDAGADGYILKNTGKAELISALATLAGGAMYFSEDVTQEMLKPVIKEKNHEDDVQLTEREKDIVKLIDKEYSNAQIAEELFISERTVETHRKNIFRKTGTKSVIGLLKWARERDII